ncbi:hypothetical protein ACEQPO_28350 [Bacillus sp. SL00103]
MRPPYIQELTKGKRIGTDIQMEGFEWIEPDLSHVRSILTASQLRQYEKLCHETAVIVESVSVKKSFQADRARNCFALLLKEPLLKG